MPKLLCPCGYVHNLIPSPDHGYLVIKDAAYEALLEVEDRRQENRGPSQGTAEFAQLLADDTSVVGILGSRLYECPQCGRLLWRRHGSELRLLPA